MFNKVKTPEELLKFMDENVKYGFVDKDNNKYYDSDDEVFYDKCYVQTGEEVLKTMVGTCYDQVELERLWFLNNNYNIKTFFIRFELDYENDLPTHTFLLFEKNNKWFYFENAFNDYRGIYEFDNIHRALEFAKDKQFEYAYKYYDAKKEDRYKLISYEYEELDLYDKNGNTVGITIHRKMPPVKLNNEYIGLSVIFIENSKGDLKKKKTSKEKKSKNSSTGGHIDRGESPIECIIRETKEEIGLDIKKEELKEFKSIIQDYKLIYPFYLKKDIDINKLVLQKDEVDYVKFMSKKELEELIDNNNFSKTHSFVYNEVIRS